MWENEPEKRARFSNGCNLDELSDAKETMPVLKTHDYVFAKKNRIRLPERFDSPRGQALVIDLTLPEGIPFFTDLDEDDNDHEDESDGEAAYAAGAVVDGEADDDDADNE